MPRIRWTHGLNPPYDYASFAEEIKQRFERLGGVPQGDVDVLFGLGPVVEITVTTDDLARVAHAAGTLVDDEAEDADKLLPHLQGTGPTTLWYEPEDRQRLGGRPLA